MKQRVSTIYLFILGTAAVIPLFFHTYLGAYSRFIADDFCTAFMANRLGILRATWYWYRTWTGRYAATLLDSTLGVLGPGVTPFVTGVVLVLWLVLVTWALWSLLPTVENRLMGAVALAAVIITTTLLLSPNLPQSLYWGQGMRSVIPPLMLSAVYLSLFRWYQRCEWLLELQILWCVAAFVATFFSGGFSETFTAAQILILAGAILCALLTHIPKRQTLLLCVALTGAVLAFGVVVIAPGNVIRQSTYPPSPGMLDILRISIAGYSVFWSKLLGSVQNIIGLLGLVGMAVLLGLQLGPSARKAWLIPFTLAAGLLLTFACFPPAAYGTSDYPPERTQILPVHFLVVTVALCGVFTGQVLAAQSWSRPALPFAAVATLGLVLCASLLSANQLYAVRNEYIDYAHEWDQADVILRDARARGEKEKVITNSGNWTHLNVLGNNPKFWINVCYSGYYDIQVLGDVPAD